MRVFRSNLRQMQQLEFKDLITTVMFSKTANVIYFPGKTGISQRLTGRDGNP